MENERLHVSMLLFKLHIFAMMLMLTASFVSSSSFFRLRHASFGAIKDAHPTPISTL